MGNEGPLITGLAFGSLAARDLAMATNKSALTKTKKRALVVQGATFGAYALLLTDNTFRKKNLRTAEGSGIVAFNVGMAAMCLYQGLKKD